MSKFISSTLPFANALLIKNSEIKWLVNALICFMLLVSTISFQALADTNIKSKNEDMRIVSLSPHLTELVFALGKEHLLVGVSDYSDYPYGQGCIDKECATQLPSVASYLGADIAAILRLKPTLILVWQGGNKAQDIARLEQLGFEVYRSSPTTLDDLFIDIHQLSSTLSSEGIGKELINDLQEQLQYIHTTFRSRKKSAIYYMSSQPLSGIGSDEWLNSLLEVCGIENIYSGLSASFVQFSMADIIRKQPQLIVAAVSDNKTDIDAFWKQHQAVLDSSVVQVNPDALHRFTPRVIPALRKLCESAYL